MVQVQRSATTVDERLLDGDSVSVPAGEVWSVKVWMHPSTSATLNVNGYTVMSVDDDSTPKPERANFSTVFADGDTIAASITGGGGQIIIRGYEVSQQVDNSYISEQFGTGESVTIPTGTWETSIVGSASNGDEVYKNGTTAQDVFIVFDAATDLTNEVFVGNFILNGGETVGPDAQGTLDGIHIGGFDVS